MAKDKKEKREGIVKKKGMLKLKPEKIVKKRKAVKETRVTVSMDECEHGPVVLKDTGLKSGKSGKSASAKINKAKLKDKKMPKLKTSSGADSKEKISTKIEEITVSSAQRKINKLQNKMILKVSSEANNEENISAKIELTTVSPGAEGQKLGKSGKSLSVKMKRKKLNGKTMPEHKISFDADEEEKISAKIEETTVSPGDDLGNQEEPSSATKKKPKKGKKKGKNQISKQEGIQSKPVEQDLKEKKTIESFKINNENAVEISSVDEDCSRGMKKWLHEYKESRPGIDILQQQIDDFISAHEAKLEQEKQEREAAAAEGGWTVVVQQKGRKKTTDAESGIAVGSVAPAAVLDKMSKKKSKEVTMDFYRFQKREAQRNEIMMLQEKFEQDRKRIQQLRAARKFRPY